MEIKSPKVLSNESLSIIISVSSPFEYIDPILGITMTKNINVLTLGVNNSNINVDLSLVQEDLIRKYAGMQGLIKSCVDNAEYIKDMLLAIILKLEMPNTEEKRIELMKTDLMNLKVKFMDMIRKSKVYQEFKVLDSTKKLKPFSQGFNTFILDRNKYTHGQLSFLKPDYSFILEYIETPLQNYKYAYIDTDILISYNNFYKEIKSVIDEYTAVIQKRKTSSAKNDVNK